PPCALPSRLSFPARRSSDLCIASRPVRMRGIGERLDPVPALPPLHLVLVNPGVAVNTPEVFAMLARKENPPLPDPAWQDLDSLLDRQRRRLNSSHVKISYAL